jgi:hypothetical protein
MFRTVPLSITSSYSLYTQQWYMSYRFVDSFRAGSGWNNLILLLLESCLEGFTTRLLNLKEERTRYPLGTRLGEPHSQSGLFRDEISCPSQKLNHDSAVFQLAAKPVKLTRPASLMFVGLISLTALRQAYRLPTSVTCLSPSTCQLQFLTFNILSTKLSNIPIVFGTFGTLVLLVLWYFWYFDTIGTLVLLVLWYFWYFWYFGTFDTIGTLVLLVLLILLVLWYFWYFWYFGTFGTLVLLVLLVLWYFWYFWYFSTVIN